MYHKSFYIICYIILYIICICIIHIFIISLLYLCIYILSHVPMIRIKIHIYAQISSYVLLQTITDGGPNIRFPGGKLIRVRRPNVGCAASMIDFAHEEIPISTKL